LEGVWPHTHAPEKPALHVGLSEILSGRVYSVTMCLLVRLLWPGQRCLLVLFQNLVLDPETEKKADNDYLGFKILGNKQRQQHWSKRHGKWWSCHGIFTTKL